MIGQIMVDEKLLYHQSSMTTTPTHDFANTNELYRFSSQTPLDDEQWVVYHDKVNVERQQKEQKMLLGTATATGESSHYGSGHRQTGRQKQAGMWASGGSLGETPQQDQQIGSATAVAAASERTRLASGPDAALAPVEEDKFRLVDSFFRMIVEQSFLSEQGAALGRMESVATHDHIAATSTPDTPYVSVAHMVDTAFEQIVGSRVDPMNRQAFEIFVRNHSQLQVSPRQLQQIWEVVDASGDEFISRAELSNCLCGSYMLVEHDNPDRFETKLCSHFLQLVHSFCHASVADFIQASSSV